MSNLTALTIAAARDGLRSKQFSALELTDAYLAAMEKARVLNSYIVETPEKARKKNPKKAKTRMWSPSSARA